MQTASYLPFMLLPWPTYSEERRGLDSTRGPNGIFINYRGTTDEKAVLTQAAERLGMSRSEFMRSVCNSAAEYILASFPESVKAE